jgi:periplasmic nitrate reductase NapE
MPRASMPERPMAAEGDISDEPPDPSRQRRAELAVFAILAVLIWPVLAVGFVGAYGFVVWIWQIIFGPPGPPG